jgi:uncharacterized protein YndB with AHSA1/START domain
MTSSSGRNTRVSHLIHAPRGAVYRAFLDPDAVASWLSPDTMRGHMEFFEPHVGGKFRMTLTYMDQADAMRGKSSEDSDTYEARFVELLPNEKIVQVVEFESDQPDFAGEMKITWILTEVSQGTEVTVLMEDIPVGISLEDNEVGSSQSLRKLAAFVEGVDKQ